MKLIVTAVLSALLGASVTFAVTRDEPAPVEPTRLVVIADRDIPPGTRLDRAFAKGELHVAPVPEALVTPAAIESADDLRGLTSTGWILENEQVPIMLTDSPTVIP